MNVFYISIFSINMNVFYISIYNIIYMNVFHISDLFYHISGYMDEKSLFTLEITNKYFNDTIKDIPGFGTALLNKIGYSI